MASGGFGELDGSVFGPLFSLCAALIDDGSAQQGLFDHVLTWAEGIPLEGKARIKLAAAAGAAAASFDTGQAAELMRRGMEDLAKLEDESKVPRDLLFFMTLMSDLTRTGDEPVWSQPLLELEGALVDTCKKFDEDVLADLLGRLSEQMFELANDARQLQYVAPKYLYGLLALPTAREAALTRSVDYVVTELEKRRADFNLDKMLGNLVFQLGAQGHAELAREVVQRIVDTETHELAESQIGMFEGFYALPDRSPVEQALFELLEEKGIAALSVSLMRQGETKDLLEFEFQKLKELRVRMELLDWAPLAAAVAMSRWGAEAGKEMLNAVRESDKRLIEASSLIL